MLLSIAIGPKPLTGVFGTSRRRAQRLPRSWAPSRGPCRRRAPSSRGTSRRKTAGEQAREALAMATIGIDFNRRPRHRPSNALMLRACLGIIKGVAQGWLRTRPRLIHCICPPRQRLSLRCALHLRQLQRHRSGVRKHDGSLEARGNVDSERRRTLTSDATPALSLRMEPNRSSFSRLICWSLSEPLSMVGCFTPATSSSSMKLPWLTTTAFTWARKSSSHDQLSVPSSDVGEGHVRPSRAT